MTKEEYLRNHKERWYLRDLDFLPEKISDYRDLKLGLVTTIEKEVSFKTFASEIEALKASLAVRELMGMKKSEWLEKRLEAARNEELKRFEGLWNSYTKEPDKYRTMIVSILGI